VTKDRIDEKAKDNQHAKYGALFRNWTLLVDISSSANNAHRHIVCYLCLVFIRLSRRTRISWKWPIRRVE